MQWPDSVKIKFQSKSARDKTNRLVVFIVIHAPHKNSYTLGPFKTDDNGELELTRQEIKEHISFTQEQSPMDYVDTLDKCDSQIAVEIESKNSLEARLRLINEFYPDDAMKLRRLFNGQSNFISNQAKYQLTIDRETRVISIDML